MFFKKLYEEYYQKLYVYALSFCSNQEVVEDLVQETFFYLWKNRKTIIITTSLNSYLYKVIYNKVMDSYRIKKKQDSTLLSYYNEAVNNVIESESDYKAEKMKKLKQCMELLPKRCKKVFYEKKINGLKSKEIANNLDISLKTVEGHISRAFKFLKECIKNPLDMRSI